MIGERRHRLAAAGFADDGDDLAAVDRVGDAVDRVHDAARGVELDVQILHREQRCRRAAAAASGDAAVLAELSIQQRFLPAADW